MRSLDPRPGPVPADELPPMRLNTVVGLSLPAAKLAPPSSTKVSMAPRHELDLPLGRRKGELRDPDASWPAAYERERVAIEGALGALAEGIEHIGSTSIPGIRAKPILDVMVGVESLDWFEDCRSRLEAMGYVYDRKATRDDPDRRVFRRGPADQRLPRTHHLHVTKFEGWYWRRILAFRDYLRRNPLAAADYERLKLDLAERFPEDGRSYTAGKGAFVREIQTIALEE